MTNKGQDKQNPPQENKETKEPSEAGKILMTYALMGSMFRQQRGEMKEGKQK